MNLHRINHILDEIVNSQGHFRIKLLYRYMITIFSWLSQLKNSIINYFKNPHFWLHLVSLYRTKVLPTNFLLVNTLLKYSALVFHLKFYPVHNFDYLFSFEQNCAIRSISEIEQYFNNT